MTPRHRVLFDAADAFRMAALEARHALQRAASAVLDGRDEREHLDAADAAMTRAQAIVEGVRGG